MASTDTKPGFRLPWSAERSELVSDEPLAVDAADAATLPQETDTPAMIDAASATTTPEAAEGDAHGVDPEPTPALSAPASPSPAAPVMRRPNKFMADLTKAMQVAAESARTDALERVTVEAKLKIESIHAESAGEATELRKRADDDVAAVREWSKAEIARIREETDERITHRKQRLEHEIEAHAAAVEVRIERVQGRIATFEAEMEAFFERLLAEQDPTHFAAMAESLPEPPPFDTDDEVTPLPTVAQDRSAASTTDTEPQAEALAEEQAAPDRPQSQPADDEGADRFGTRSDGPSASRNARLAAFGLPADFAAAEAEAAAFTSDDEGGDETMPDIADEAIAARLAGLGVANDTAASDTVTTRLVVTGLISVASIAGFKRHLTRAGGVQTVTVSSGPDGEFVFNVGHDASVALRDLVPTLPGFAARVTSEDDGELTVSAHDPETGD